MSYGPRLRFPCFWLIDSIELPVIFLLCAYQEVFSCGRITLLRDPHQMKEISYMEKERGAQSLCGLLPPTTTSRET